MAEETITFESIRKIQTEEQGSQKLIKLPENFYKNITSYMEQKQKISEMKGDRKASMELKNIQRLIEDIFNRRERKILNQALISVRTGMPPENLTDEEKIYFDEIVRTLKNRRSSILENLFKEKEKKVALSIIFKEDIPEFVGADLKTYGPFKKGDTAILPEENMKIFLEKGLAEELKITE